MPLQAYGSPIATSSVCNSAIPSNDVYGRFLRVVRSIPSKSVSILDKLDPGYSRVQPWFAQVRFLTANGFYVLLDNQFNMDTCADFGTCRMCTVCHPRLHASAMPTQCVTMAQPSQLYRKFLFMLSCGVGANSAHS